MGVRVKFAAVVTVAWSTVNSSKTRDGSSTGSGFRNTASVRVKMAVLAPMPSASDSTATNVNPGLRASVRKPYFRSCRSWSISVSRRMIALFAPGGSVERQPDVIFSQAGHGGARSNQVVELGQLPALVESGVAGKAMQHR